MSSGKPLRSPALDRWWPTTQSLDLVEGPIEEVARAVGDQVTRFVGDEPVRTAWEKLPDLDAAFGAAPDFTNVPTFFLVLPTRSKWTVLWNNGFGCDGYDSLCWCLTQMDGMTTVHWSAHDASTTFQSGATFCYRRRDGTALVERTVHAYREDERWLFRESGDPLPEEDVAGYAAPRKSDRLNEQRMSELLARLGAAPWDEGSYALAERETFVVHRRAAPSTITRMDRGAVLARA